MDPYNAPPKERIELPEVGPHAASKGSWWSMGSLTLPRLLEGYKIERLPRSTTRGPGTEPDHESPMAAPDSPVPHA